MEIGAVLKDLRITRNFTQVQVASKTRVSQTFLSQIETGAKNPSKSMLARLCDLYNVPPQIVIFKSLTAKDVPKKKVSLFYKLKPVIDSLIDEIIKN